MRINRFEDIEARQLARELTRKVYVTVLGFRVQRLAHKRERRTVNPYSQVCPRLRFKATNSGCGGFI